MQCQNFKIALGTMEEFNSMLELVSIYRPRIGKWWSKQALEEVLEKRKNRVAICAFEGETLVGFIVLQLWGSKGKFKGHCKSLITISTRKGLGTLLQSILPFNTVGYVSKRNTTQNNVMKKSGYVLRNKAIFQGKEMNIWIKELNPEIYLQSAQKSLEEKLLSMAKWERTMTLWQPMREESQLRSVSA